MLYEYTIFLNQIPNDEVDQYGMYKFSVNDEVMSNLTWNGTLGVANKTTFWWLTLSKNLLVKVQLFVNLMFEVVYFILPCDQNRSNSET